MAFNALHIRFLGEQLDVQHEFKDNRVGPCAEKMQVRMICGQQHLMDTECLRTTSTCWQCPMDLVAVKIMN
mgnify:CR=1 FL=1